MKTMTQDKTDTAITEQNEALNELFIDELSDLYDEEKQLTKALLKMARAAQSDELREAFESHLEETEEHVRRLERAAVTVDEKLKRKPCKAMQGLVEEGSELMKEKKGSPALDAALIAAAQKVEHYEIASYGAVCAWAKELGHDEALQILEETLGEEKEADSMLTEIAENSANRK
jgi:ferritin-like metal-binding protein YciE